MWSCSGGIWSRCDCLREILPYHRSRRWEKTWAIEKDDDIWTLSKWILLKRQVCEILIVFCRDHVDTTKQGRTSIKEWKTNGYKGINETKEADAKLHITEGTAIDNFEERFSKVSSLLSRWDDRKQPTSPKVPLPALLVETITYDCRHDERDHCDHQTWKCPGCEHTVVNKEGYLCKYPRERLGFQKLMSKFRPEKV